MSVCFICKKTLEGSQIKIVKAKGVEGLLERAVAKSDIDNEQFLRTVSEVTVHRKCYHYYCGSRTDHIVHRRRSSSVSSSASEEGNTTFDFMNNCFICARTIENESNKCESRKRRVCHVSNEDIRKSIMQLIRKRIDEDALGIANHTADVPNLANVGAKYHHDCSKKLYAEKWQVECKNDERHNNIDTAMEYVFAYLHENSEECQFNMSDLMASIKGEYIPCKMTVIERLKAHYKDEIVVFNESGKNCIICFKGLIYNVISKNLSSREKMDPREARLQKVRDAAAIILEDIRSRPYETNQYPSTDEFLKNVNNLIPETLSVLLNGIICKAKRKSMNAAQKKCTSIAHSIISATRPASFISPLLLGVGSFLYKKYGSNYLIDILSSLGFSASYNSVALFEDSCAFRRPRNVLSQFVFDNADFNEPIGLGKINVSAMENITSQATKIVPTSCDLMWLNGKLSCTLNISGWNDFMIDATAEKPFQRRRIICLPFMNVPPSDYNTILTSLQYSIKKCKASNQSTCIVTFDQPLYWKARDITASADPNSDLSKVVVRLGGFHLLMSFIGAIGYIMSGSGLEDIFKLIYAENCVANIMSGHAYSRAVRAHLLLHVSLTKIILDSMEFNEEERDYLDDALTDIDRTAIIESVCNPVFDRVMAKFEEALIMLENKGATAKLWVQYYRLVTLLKHFIEAERSSNWSLHLKTIRNMLPIFHASGHFLYAKSIHLYLQDMLNLDKVMAPEEFHSFTALGCFTIRRTDKLWSGIMSDQTTEQTRMRMFKSSGGLTHGRGITESTLASWALQMIRLRDVCEQGSEYGEILKNFSKQHVNYRDSRIQRDNEDVKKIDHWLASHDFTLHRPELICIANGIIASEDINCHRTFEIGEELISNIIGSDFQHLTYHRKSKVLPLAAMASTVEGEKSSVLINPFLLYQQMSISTEFMYDIIRYFEYELSPFPLSLFTEDGMRKGTKSSLFDAFTPVEISSNISAAGHFIVDGGFLLHKVVWDRNSSFNDIIDKYIKYVQKHYGHSATIIFDGYSDDPDIAGTKSWERLRRTKKLQSTEVIFDKYTVPTLSQEKFFANEKNKTKFIELLKTSFSETGFNVDQAKSDADLLIVRTAFAASHSFEKVTIVAEDIDILVLLTAIGKKITNVFFLKPSKGRTAKQLYSPSGFRYGDIIKDNLLFLHAFSGCDTTSAAYNIDKMKFISTLEKCCELASATAIFLNNKVKPAVVTSVGERFFISLYGGNNDDSLDRLRHKIFVKSITKNTFNLASLPPTQDAARFHSLRVYHQVQSWLRNYIDPLKWGWKKYGQILMPIQSSKPPAPPGLLKLISCRCKGNCEAMCGCRKAGLKCSALCLNCSDETCSNIVDVSKLIELNDFEDEMPTQMPLHSLPIFKTSTPEVEPDPQLEPGPSKRWKT